MPNYIPQIKLKTKINQDDLNQYRFDDLQLRQEMEKALRETYYNKVDEKLLKTPELNRDIEDHVFQRYHTTLFHYVNWVRKVFNLEGKDIVEIGCGTGSSTAAFAHFCKHIYAYEIVESSLLAAKKRMEIMGINNVDIIAVNPSNSLETIKKNHQDGVGVILLFAVLEHMTIAERLETLRETWNLLAPEGILIVAETPNRLTYYDHHTSWLHFFHMLPEDLAIEYYQKSPRADFKHSINKTIEESKISGGKEKIIRWGNGVSFHEFEIALKSDLDNLIIADGDDEEMRSIYPMTEQEELLRNYFVKQKIEQPLTFTNSVLNFILQKKINIK
jgi:S-adenosylmethionine-dependent methyltransferase